MEASGFREGLGLRVNNIIIHWRAILSGNSPWPNGRMEGDSFKVPS